MRNIFGVVLLGCALSACAGSGSTSQVTPARAEIDSRGVAEVTVTSAISGGDKIAAELQTEIVNQIISKRVFRAVKLGPEPADVRIEAKLTEANDVSQAGRILLGGLAGQAKVQADVKIVDSKTGNLLAEIIATGLSSGGDVFAGTSREAIRETATQITDYVLRNRKL